MDQHNYFPYDDRRLTSAAPYSVSRAGSLAEQQRLTNHQISQASPSTRHTQFRTAVRPGAPATNGVLAGRVTKSSPSRKRTSNRSKKSNHVSLPGPFSQLTVNSKLPVRDMDAYINRPLDVRRVEASTRKDGKVPRPLNSFIIYRSAYSERAKEYGKGTNNHQVVSALAGDSWKLETADIRAKYEALGEVEKEMHKLAFPSYKYIPGKSKDTHDDEEEDAADPNDGESDAEYIPTRGTRSRPRTTAEANPQLPTPVNSSPLAAIPFSSSAHGGAYDLSLQPQPMYQMQPSMYGYNGDQNYYSQSQWAPYGMTSGPYFPQMAAPAPMSWTNTPPSHIAPVITQQMQSNGAVVQRRHSINPFPSHSTSLLTQPWPQNYGFLASALARSQGTLHRDAYPADAPRFSPTTVNYLSSLLDIDNTAGPSQQSIDPQLLSSNMNGDMDAAYSMDQNRET